VLSLLRACIVVHTYTYVVLTLAALLSCNHSRVLLQLLYCRVVATYILSC
jgi:hypothetical protein